MIPLLRLSAGAGGRFRMFRLAYYRFSFGVRLTVTASGKVVFSWIWRVYYDWVVPGEPCNAQTPTHHPHRCVANLRRALGRSALVAAKGRVNDLFTVWYDPDDFKLI